MRILRAIVEAMANLVTLALPISTLVAEITYLTWTADNLLRHTVYVGLREEKSAMEIRREATRG